MHRIEQPSGAKAGIVECGSDPVASLVSMFVEMVQKGRIAGGSARPCARSS